MSHGEISAHKLPQLMIRVGSHTKRGVVSCQLTRPNLPQPSHITVTAGGEKEVSCSVASRRLSGGFLAKRLLLLHPASDWETFQKVGLSLGVTFRLKRNSHNLECVPWGRRCQAGMIGGFQNSTAVARTEGRVTQITPKQCKKYPGLSHIDLERPHIVLYQE